MAENIERGNVPIKENTLTGRILPCRAFLEYDWKGSLRYGEASYSILLEAMVAGIPKTDIKHGVVGGCTRNQAELKIAIILLSRLKPCRVQIVSKSDYLTTGIQGRFKRQQSGGYQNIKNADLIEEFLRAAEGYQVSAVKENRTEYTEYLRSERAKLNKTGGSEHGK